MDPRERLDDGMHRSLARHLVAAALVLLAATAALAQQPAATGKSPGVEASGAAGNSDLSAMPLERFHAIVERPLFSPTRRPPASLPGEVDDGARQFQLKGAVVSASEQHALIVSQSTGKSYQVRTGDMVEGWRVERITEQSVAFTKGALRTLAPLLPPHAHP